MEAGTAPDDIASAMAGSIMASDVFHRLDVSGGCFQRESHLRLRPFL
jgi:hypothetical protein